MNIILSLSEDFIKLWESNKFLIGIFETLYLTFVSTLIAYLIGIPLGVLLNITSKNGIHPNKWVNVPLSFIVNIFRSIPFIVLMVALLPVSDLIVGKTYGNEAMIITLIIAAAPYVARMVESSLKEVEFGVIEAASSMGASNWQIITKVLLPEAKPSLIVGAVISIVTVLGYSAMASIVSGGGLGAIAIVYGHQRLNDDIIWFCVILMIIIVQIIQEVGMFVSRKVDKRIK